MRDLGAAQQLHDRLLTWEQNLGEVVGLLDDGSVEACALREGELETIESQLKAAEQERGFFRPAPPQTGTLPPLPSAFAYLDHPIVWKISSVDSEHPKPWLSIEGPETLAELIDQLRHLERFTWRTVMHASEHNHEWEDTSRWEANSRERARTLTLDDQSSWFQLELGRRGRLFGFRNTYVFNIVWWDRDHEVYPTARRN
jgi:hypothetical protein